MLFLLLGGGRALLFSTAPVSQQPLMFWDKFGWQTQYAWKYKKGGKLKLLPRTLHFDGHHHHLHVGKYTPNVIEVTQ
ncbi:hypothetical protein HBO15_05935 [Pseudomonas sp. WS 5111]|jgi:hypothetical protein|uniref:hypothetical protein n=1 Tax=unclassified Pseudomonas TaxID=196821 RepID=UPI00147311B2|nr:MULTISPECIES: hypothetical protein [unclassified Pseudomonas]NMX66885.1 hypothetical protein [Pseudomonas sp. WS 5111]NMX84949.1 hypothetical protein [Pseudomonas sp. WS 5010]